MENLSIKTFEMLDVPRVKVFTDSDIGIDYFSEQELVLLQRRSTRQGKNASFILLDGESVVGLRLSFPAGNWLTGKGGRISDSLWPYSLQSTAYFQSLYVGEKYQKMGWGKKMSNMSIAVLKDLGAKGVVCHSWVESPDQSSKRYLTSMGFKGIALYRNYWKNVDYECPICGKPCACSAEEMYLTLETGA